VRLGQLLRMLKLARVFKASRVLNRHMLDVALHRWEWTFSVIKILKLIAILMLYTHFQACMWGLFSGWTDPPNWLTVFAENFASYEMPGQQPSWHDKYWAALYWSGMTLTGIGYGEMLPQNSTERGLCTLYMLLSGMLWTYVIGSVAAIATTLDPNRIMYENTMDQLNFFMRERSLPKSMRMTLREFFEAARRVNSLNDDADLLRKMSPLLQGSVALAANKEWIDQVWYFRGLEATRSGVEFIAALAKSLVIRNYVAKERLPIGQLYILRKGMCVKNWRFKRVRAVWGEDFVLDVEELIDHAQAVALTYVEVYTVRRHALDALLDDCAVAKLTVQRAARKMTIQRSFLKYLTMLNGKRGPCSFIVKSCAAGVDLVDPQSDLTDAERLENRLDQQSQQMESMRLMFGMPTPGDPATGDQEGDDSAVGTLSNSIRNATVGGVREFGTVAANLEGMGGGGGGGGGAEAAEVNELRLHLRRFEDEMRSELGGIKSMMEQLLAAMQQKQSL